MTRSESSSDASMRYMTPSGGPEGWKPLLAVPERHWVRGRSARTLAYAWEEAIGWLPEIASLLGSESKLERFRPIFGFPEFQIPLPGGRRPTQADLLVLVTDGLEHLTLAVEGRSMSPSVRWLASG